MPYLCYNGRFDLGFYTSITSIFGTNIVQALAQAELLIFCVKTRKFGNNDFE